MKESVFFSQECGTFFGLIPPFMEEEDDSISMESSEGFHGWQHLPIAAENKKNPNKTHPRTPSSIKTGSITKRMV